MKKTFCVTRDNNSSQDHNVVSTSKLVMAISAITMLTAFRSLYADVVYITQGSTSGYTMTDGNTYVIQNSVSFSNATAGGSGMTVADGATVVLYVPADVTLTTAGANGSGTTGGGAGIRVPATSTLIITGEGTLEATGGDAGSGAKGGEGRIGSNGDGGDGGGGGGAALGGIGGSGGVHGTTDGNPGNDGEDMGVVFAIGQVTVHASLGQNGGFGSYGAHAKKQYLQVYDYKTGKSTYEWVYSCGGGGGGGAGAIPQLGIGGGGSSGGAGGRGNGSNSSWQTVTGAGGESKVQKGQGGDGCAGGAAGEEGAAGTLFVSPTATVDVEREKQSATTHTAAQYAITFDANDGIQTSATSIATATLGCALPDCISISPRIGYLLNGWKDDTGTVYYANDGTKALSTYQMPSNIVLHAEWIKDPTALVITPTSETIFEDSLTVAMKSSIEGATIYYTLDGSEPMVNSTVYTRKFRISGKTTVKAIAVCEGWANSEVVVANYALGQCPDPVITSDVGETFAHGSAYVSIAWECEDGVVRYTTDGSDVTETSPEYTGTLTINDTTTIKTKAFSTTYFDSQQIVLTVTKNWESVAMPVIDGAETFTGGKTKVSMSCANEGATIYYTLDGSEPNSHSKRYSGTFEVRDTTVVKAYAVLSDYADSEVSTKTITKMWGIGDSVGLPDHSFTTNGAAGWVDENGQAMRSGKISDNQVSILQSSFVGKGHLSFELKTSCEEDDPDYIEYDHAEVWIDGIRKMKKDGIHDWETYEYDLDTDTHTVAWKYVKDDLDETTYIGEDCIWIRNVVWQPELTCTTQVPVKLDWIRSKYGDLGNYYFNYEEKANETASNGRKVWECYVAGEEPTDSNSVFHASIEMVDGTPIIHWLPDLNSNSLERIYTVWGKTNLADKAWHSPTNECSHFFKVTVEMP